MVVVEGYQVKEIDVRVNVGRWRWLTATGGG